MNKGVFIAVISSIIIFLDYLTKKIIVAKIMLYESINVLPFLNIVHVQNRGAAFSILSNMGNKYFIGIYVIAIIAIVIYLSRLTKGLELIALSLILGGAVGNLIDRILIGKVTDFIDVFVGRWHWPAFNVADSALTIGIVLFLLANIKQEKETKETKE
ncbi:MAG: signal peptidase II [Nitrospirae bacterium]|nr:signal peptidase II [Nitrospirota bacterium]